MLSPEDRALYSACFRAPEGYSFDCGLGTTYTLDLETLLFVPIALSAGGGDPETALADPVALLGAIHQISERLTVFCEDGRTNAPAFTHSIASLLEEAYVPVRAPRGNGLFHPKLWLLRFESDYEGEDDILRVVILSRNATTSRCWDTLVQLEGTPYPNRRVADSRELAELVSALPSLASSGITLSADRRKQIERLTDQAARTAFYAPEPFDQESVARFITLGLEGGEPWRPDEGERLLAISPFLSESALEAVSVAAPERILISREETLDRQERGSLAGWECSGLAEGAGGEAEAEGLDEDNTTSDAAPYGLHAKVFAVEMGKRTTWWFGSTNLTEPALNGRNVEFMVRLEGRTRKVGIDSFLDDGFRGLTRAYDTQTPRAVETAEERAATAVEQLQRKLIQAPFSASCQPQEESKWDVHVRGKLGPIDGATVTVNLLTLPVAMAQRLEGAPLVFGELDIEKLTAFVVFRAEVEVDGAQAQTSFTRRVPIEGLPYERVSRIMRSVLRNRGNLLSYLSFWLGNARGTGVGGGSGSKRLGGGGESGSAANEEVLLENLMRALRREPRMLRSLRAMLERMKGELADDASEEIVPPDLAELLDLMHDLIPEPTKTPSPSGDSRGV